MAFESNDPLFQNCTLNVYDFSWLQKIDEIEDLLIKKQKPVPLTGWTRTDVLDSEPGSLFRSVYDVIHYFLRAKIHKSFSSGHHH
jgi:hypothetical protein